MEIVQKSLKKVIASTLVIFMLLSQIPFNVYAEEINTPDNQNITNENTNDNTINDEGDNEDNQELTDEDIRNIESQSNNESNQNASEDADNNISNVVNNPENHNEENNDESEQSSQPRRNLRGNPGEEENTYEGNGGFKIALRWGGTSNLAYTWNATTNEDRVIKMTCYYQNEMTERAYGVGELTITIPGIGKLNRGTPKRATDVAADIYGSANKKRDWSYKYNSNTDTYTFYNNHAIEQGATFSGSFEMLYEFTSRNCVNNYNQNIQATIKDGNKVVVSPELTLTYTSVPDTYYLNKSARVVTSVDGLGKYVGVGKSANDYAWVQYTFNYGSRAINARCMANGYITDVFPAGCVVCSNTGVTYNDDETITYKLENATIQSIGSRTSSIVVGYPKSMAGQTIQNTAEYYCLYYDDDEPTLLDQASAGVTLQEIDGSNILGMTIRKDITPSYVYYDDITKDINFSANLYATSKAKNDDTQEYTIAIGDDLLEIYSDDKENEGSKRMYTLKDSEYTFKSVTVPSKSYFRNGNGTEILDENCTLKIYALKKSSVTDDLSSRKLSNYVKVYEGIWTNNATIVSFDEDVVAFRMELSGLTESVQQFYVNTRGTINIEDSIVDETYTNPLYIINYEYTEFLNQNGSSLVPEISRQDYTDGRIYDRDQTIYGKGLLRATDTIVFQERPVTPPQPHTPGSYSSNAKINSFAIDESQEFFGTQLTHRVNIYNKDAEEIKHIQIYGVTDDEELQIVIDSIQLTYNGLTFKNALPAEVNLQEYVRERSQITKDGRETLVEFNFEDNPIISNNFSLGYTIDAKLAYEDYYESTRPRYTVNTYAYIADGELTPNSTVLYKEKTMSKSVNSVDILLALASHQQIINMAKTLYSGEYVEEHAVAPMRENYSYRLKLRNGYNTLLNTEFIDIIEHAELTEVDGNYPYSASEWFGIFKDVDTSYIEKQGYTVNVYYATTITPQDEDWILLENHNEGRWTTVNENVKAIKICIDGEIVENSIMYADINMEAPYDENLIDKMTYNTYMINCDAIDLYSGAQSTYLENMPSNVIDLRLAEKEYNVYLTKLDSASGLKMNGAKFGIYNSNDEKIAGDYVGILGFIPFKNIKEGTYTIKEDVTPSGYKKVNDSTLTIENGHYIVVRDGVIVAEGDEVIENNIPTIEITIENEREEGSISLHIIDEYKDENKNEIPLANAKFNIYDQDGNYIETKETDDNGDLLFDNLPWGTIYTIEEIEAPSGYEGVTTTIYLDKSDIDREITLENTRKIGSANLILQDEVDQTKLDGAVYGIYANENIYDKNGDILYEKDTLIVDGTTDENGVVLFENLTWGNYYIKEIETVYGYELSEQKHEFTINAQNVETLQENTEDSDRSEATLKVVKVNNVGEFLEGAEFGIYHGDGTEITESHIVDGEVELNFTSEGQYAWTKDAADGVWRSNNYQRGNTTTTMTSEEFTMEQTGTIKFLWSVSSQSDTTDYAYYTITNTETGDTIGGESTKIGSTSRGTSYDTLQYDEVNQELEAGKYIISFTYRKDNSTNTGLDRAYVRYVKIPAKVQENFLVTSTTDATGTLTFENLEWGDYCIKEIGIPEGYEPLDTTFSFIVDRETFKNNESKSVVEVTNQDTGLKTSVITNTKQLAKVKLTKYACDVNGDETDETLAGAVYELYQSNGTLIGEYTTDGNGQIEVENLNWNGYYFLEKKAPEGYSTSDKKVAFVVNSKNATFEQELSAYDKREAGEITINYTIPASSVYGAHGNSSFILKIVGKDANGIEQITLNRAFVISEEDLASQDENGNITKTMKIPDLNPYIYEITQEDTYRYELTSITPGENASVEGNKGIVDLLNAATNKADITFSSTKQTNSKLTHSEIQTNSLQSEYYLIGFEAIPKQEEYETGYLVTGNDFTYKLFYSGGQEVPVDSLTGITVNSQEEYTRGKPGDYIESVEYTIEGRTFTTEVQLKWVTPYDYFTYTTNNDGSINITGLNEKYASAEVLYIPGTYNGRRVSQVGPATSNISKNNKLKNIDNVRTLNIAEGVERIGIYAFYNCNNLEKVELSEGLNTIRSYAFEECRNLRSISFPSSIKTMENGVFHYCSNIEEVDLSDTQITRITTSLLSSCDKLKKVLVPNSLTRIDNSSFGLDRNLESIDLSNTQVTSIGDYAFDRCENLTSVRLPDGFKSIGQRAFWQNSSLEEVNFPEGMTTIADYAFDSCTSLINVELPDTITSLGRGVFFNCTNLESAKLPNNLLTIPADTFSRCSNLTSVDIPDNVVTIGSEAFLGCSSLPNFTIPDTVTTIESNAFNGCRSFTSIDIPESVTEIRYGAFQNCEGLTEVDIPDGITSVADMLFRLCTNLTNVDIPEGVTSIGNASFYGCSSLTSIDIPDGVTTIGNNAFEKCTNLAEPDLPQVLTSIGQYAFYQCYAMKSMDIPESVTQIGKYAFSECNNLTDINIPQNITSIEEGTYKLCSKLTSIDIPGGVTSIGASAFSRCSSIDNIVLPAGITKINNNTFESCSNLTSINIPDGVTSIGSYAFQSCAKLESIDIPDGVTSIANHAFSSCSSIEVIDISNTQITVLSTAVFASCKNLKEIYLPDSINRIEVDCLCWCTSLETLDLSNTHITTMGDEVFYYDTSLKKVILPEGLTNISKRSFMTCSNLEEIYIPSSVTSVGQTAFSYANNLTTINYGGSEEQFSQINVETYGNERFLNAVVNYNYVP